MSVGGFGVWIIQVLNFVLLLAILIGLVFLIVWVVRRLSGGAQSGTQSVGGPSPRDIVQARYARGEITREEYQQILSDLDK